MEEVRLKNSPKETGWFIGLKDDNEPFVFYYRLDNPEINIPWEFSGNPNLKFILDMKTWIVTKVNTATKEMAKWAILLQIQPLKDSITSNVDLEMKYRDSLVGKWLKIENDVYKIINKMFHNHCWTIYHIENLETRLSRQIQLENYDMWSFNSENGTDKIEVEILSTYNNTNDS
jgi:hypothetical protein